MWLKIRIYIMTLSYTVEVARLLGLLLLAQLRVRHALCRTVGLTSRVETARMQHIAKADTQQLNDQAGGSVRNKQHSFL